MAQLKIDEVLPSKSGKAWRVKSGGKWYGAFGDSGIEAHTGKLIEAEITTSEKYGLGIAKYKVIGIEDSRTATETKGPLTAKQPETPVNWLPFASNTVNAAIGAKLITTPDQIKAWVFACKNAAEGAASGDVGF